MTTTHSVAVRICDAYDRGDYDTLQALCYSHPDTRLLSISIQSDGCLPDVQPMLIPTDDIDYIYDTIRQELDAQGAPDSTVSSVTLDDCRHDGAVPLHGLYSLSWQYLRAGEIL